MTMPYTTVIPSRFRFDHQGCGLVTLLQRRIHLTTFYGAKSVPKTCQMCPAAAALRCAAALHAAPLIPKTKRYRGIR